jgi:hypothetical protein
MAEMAKLETSAFTPTLGRQHACPTPEFAPTGRGETRGAQALLIALALGCYCRLPLVSLFSGFDNR